RALVAALPLVAVAAHLAWRRLTYGAWLPNTWVAKQVAPWPACGLRYLASFAFEYALWPWLGVVALALRRASRPALPPALAAAGHALVRRRLRSPAGVADPPRRVLALLGPPRLLVAPRRDVAAARRRRTGRRRGLAGARGVGGGLSRLGAAARGGARPPRVER